MSPPPPGRDTARTRGASLILVVWAIGLMAVIGALVARDAHLGARESRLLQDDLAARLLIESGIRLTLDRLDGPERAEGRSFPHVCDLAEGRLILDVRPVSAFIDLNAAPEELLAALFAVLGAPEREADSLAARIADFRDADASPRPGGAEHAEYRRAGLPHGPANRPFNRIGEASEVLGMPPALLLAAMPHLTVQSYSTRVSPAYASAEVRAALERFAAVPAATLDDEDWDTGMAGGLSPVSAGPVVIRIEAQLPAGRRASFAGTFSAPMREPGSLRTLVEEYPAGGAFITAAGAELPPPVACL
ncbi:general secretion pathway protein GspK [Hyphomonas sp.]|uniref:general secretion pathway protein GspK n=1 Tax=Hyphomonas sp. TaxID=87 RepID=UPI00391A7E89